MCFKTVISILCDSGAIVSRTESIIAGMVGSVQGENLWKFRLGLIRFVIFLLLCPRWISIKS